jgi:hypothetical protein
MLRLLGSARVVGALLLLVGSTTALAEIKDIFTITAQCSYGQATWKISGDVDLKDGEQFHWRLERPVQLIDPYTGWVLGTLQDAYTTLIGDPQVSLGFLVQAGEVQTDFEISSALLSFPTINPAKGRASSQVTLTDLDGDGARFIGGHSGKGYLAQYNGYVPNGSTFTAQIGDFVAPPGGSNALSENDPFDGSFRAIAGDVNNMSTQFRFSLSPFDTASGTSNFEIIPEPASVALLGLIGLALLRRVR